MSNKTRLKDEVIKASTIVRNIEKLPQMPEILPGEIVYKDKKNGDNFLPCDGRMVNIQDYPTLEPMYYQESSPIHITEVFDGNLTGQTTDYKNKLNCFYSLIKEGMTNLTGYNVINRNGKYYAQVTTYKNPAIIYLCTSTDMNTWNVTKIKNVSELFPNATILYSESVESQSGSTFQIIMSVYDFDSKKVLLHYYDGTKTKEIFPAGSNARLTDYPFIAHNGTTWLIISGDKVYTCSSSSNMETWTKVSDYIGAYVSKSSDRLEWYNGKWWITGSQLYYSTNGATWTKAIYPDSSNSANHFHIANNVLWCVTSKSFYGAGSLYYSTSTTTPVWNVKNMPAFNTGLYNSISYVDGYYFMETYLYNNSPDGITHSDWYIGKSTADTWKKCNVGNISSDMGYMKYFNNISSRGENKASLIRFTDYMTLPKLTNGYYIKF